MSTLASRMIGSARLDAKSYEQVEADSTSTVQAVGIVILPSASAASGTGITDPGGVAGLLAAAVISWLIWVLLTLFIGTQLLPETETRADIGQVLRTTGFSATPGILRIFAIVPV